MSDTQLYATYRAHAARFLIAAILFSWQVIGIVIAAYFGAIMVCVYFFLALMFFALMSVIEFNACNDAHKKYVRSLKSRMPMHFLN
jgi:hypothetical protein